MKILLLIVALGLIAACPERDPAADLDASACVEYRKDVPVQVNRNLDILFVVDTSPSMAGEASRLEAHLGQFAAVLETMEGGMPNVHVGIVSADVAARGGRLESEARVAGCTPPEDGFIRDIAFANGVREANYTGSLADALVCIGALPATGSDIEQPLEAARRGLTTNAGFLRDDAFLLLVFIGDEDDCSGGAAFSLGESEERSAWRCFADSIECDQPTDTAGVKTGCTVRATPATLGPVADYVEFFRTVKADPTLVAVTAVTTDVANPVVSVAATDPILDPQCSSDTAGGWPAPRMRAVLDGFPQRSAAASVCDADWLESAALLADLNVRTLEAPCLDANIDIDPNTAGIQHECVVSQARYDGDALVEDILIPECSEADPPDSERPCFRIDHRPDWCPDTATGASFEVLRGRENVPAGTLVSARCFAGCS